MHSDSNGVKMHNSLAKTSGGYLLCTLLQNQLQYVQMQATKKKTH